MTRGGVRIDAYARARSLRTLNSSTGRSGIDDPEGRADGAFHQMDVAAMGADQFGGDRKAQPAAAGPARGLECLEQMLAGLGGNAGAGVGDLDNGDRALATPGDANLQGRGVASSAGLRAPAPRCARD